MKTISTALIVVLCAVSLSACSIYRLGTRQGNEVTSEKLAQLESAENREQVLNIMGSPLVQDPFHNNRWDYVYYYQKHGAETKLRRISVFFDGNQVQRIEQDGLTPIADEDSSETQEDKQQANDANADAQHSPQNTGPEDDAAGEGIGPHE